MDGVEGILSAVKGLYRGAMHQSGGGHWTVDFYHLPWPAHKIDPDICVTSLTLLIPFP